MFEFSNFCRVLFQLILTALFCITELVAGQILNSNTLIADSFHMFSDVVSLTVSLWAVYKKDQPAQSLRKSYGYRRAEPLGAMIHGALLLGLAFSVSTDAIMELFETSKVDQPKYALIVGSLGLLVDTSGLCLFFQSDLENANMNVRSLFLEKIGDFAGTIVVITSCALSLAFEDSDWVVYVDPCGTLCMAAILLAASYQIFKMTVRILMQDAPQQYPVVELLKEVETQCSCHVVKWNIWQVDADELVISIVVNPLNSLATALEYQNLQAQVITVLRNYSNDYQLNNFTVQVGSTQEGTVYLNEAMERLDEKPRMRALSLTRKISITDKNNNNIDQC